MTDLHFGKKSNSPLHNEDCIRYLEWFCAQVRSDPTIDYIAFLGDWNENRSAINLSTLDFSYRGAKMLNDLGMPVFFVVGNHDLYHKHTREIHSVVPFQEFTNFTVINTPTVVESIHGKALFSPYLFSDEYPTLDKYLDLPFWAGHFEFKGFRITGYNVVMTTGPDPTEFAGPKHIMSGHFHQRQSSGNIHYIGNCFPMDFGDAGDFDRGMMVYDHILGEPTYYNWTDCPKYVKTNLTSLLDGGYELPIGARVKCLIDTPISFEESVAIRENFMNVYKLREFGMEESHVLVDVLQNTDGTVDPIDGAVSTDAATPDKLDTIDELVLQMITNIKSDHIDTAMLIEQYKRLM